MGDGGGGEDYALKEIKNIEEEASVNGVREREGHLVGGQSRESTGPTSAPFPLTLTLGPG